MTFKIGQTLHRFKGVNNGIEAGYVGTLAKVQHLDGDPDGPWLTFEDGHQGYAASFETVPEGPVRTVTRREVVDGLYGIVAVYREQDQVRVTLTREDGTPDQLEAAARTLQQLAEALREG